MLIINLLGLGLIALIIWWFWLYKPEVTQLDENNSQSELTIIVEDGTYQPANISIAENKPVTLTFIRKDASPCAGTVLFPELEMSGELPLNKPFVVSLPAMTKGQYAFHCQMKMYSGNIVVE